MKRKKLCLSKITAVLLCGIMVFSSIIMPIKASAVEIDNSSGFVNEKIPVAVASNSLVQVRIVYTDKDEVKTPIQSGTGFLVNANTVVTCNPVVHINSENESFTKELIGSSYDKNNFSIEIVAGGDVTIPATVKNFSETSDFAIVQFNESIPSRVPVSIGFCDNVESTQIVYALGFPTSAVYHQNPNIYTSKDVAITDGKVIKNTKIDGVDYIQHSASITEGNLGGPLVDKNGAVIGVNRYTDGDYSFAINIEQIAEVLDSHGIEYTRAGQSTVTSEPAIESDSEEKMVSIVESDRIYSEASAASAPESSSNSQTDMTSGRELGVTDYTYTITPILEPFNEYFFVKTDNPDPKSFQFADKSSVYSEESTIVLDYDSWYDKVQLYADIKYENEETGRVNGGYIFKSSNTDGGEIVLQSRNDSYYSSNVTWNDTDVKIKLPTLEDEIDYLIGTYAKESSFFDNMDAVQSGFSSICLYSGSSIRGKLIKPNDYWCVAAAGHIDQSFYIYSPYDREDSQSLFASAIYPFRYDSLGFPSMMGAVSERLDSSSSYKWNSNSHAHIDVTYGAETHTYGGQGFGKGQRISEDKIKQYFTFGTSETKITLKSIRQLLQDYAAVEMDDDIPREDELTWKKICNDVGEGAWARILGSNLMSNGKFQTDFQSYTYFYKKGEGKNFSDDEWGIGYRIYWGGDLGYACDAWVDGRYIGKWRYFVPGEKFEDHPTSDIILNQVNIPQITYDYTYEYNFFIDKYEKVYSNIQITEKAKTVLFSYGEEIWKAKYDAFDDGCADYSEIAELVEKGLIDERYLDMVTLTLDEVKALEVDKNTNIVPGTGFIYDGSAKPGTPYTYKYGEIDDDGEITSADSLMILRQSVGLENFNDAKRALADVDNDGKITSADALEVLRYSVGLQINGNTGEIYK